MYRIKQLRKEHGWTQEYLGRLLNVNKSVISKYENGKHALTAEIIINLSRIFEVSADYLLGISSEKNPLFYKQNSFDTKNDSILESKNYTIEHTITATEEKILHYFNRLNEENQDASKGYMVHLYKEEMDDSK